MKKTWDRPQLQVLARGRQEESILSNCKAWDGGPWGADPNDVQLGCSQAACAWCNIKSENS